MDLLSHTWGTLRASATELLTALGPLCTHAKKHIFEKFANAMQLVLCDKLQ